MRQHIELKHAKNIGVSISGLPHPNQDKIPGLVHLLKGNFFQQLISRSAKLPAGFECNEDSIPFLLCHGSMYCDGREILFHKQLC